MATLTKSIKMPSALGPSFGVFVVAALFCLPLMTDRVFFLHIGVFICLNAILTQGLFLVFRTGQLSLCHAAFAGLGAYCAAIWSQTLGLHSVGGIIVGTTAAGLVALIIGAVSLPLRGAYFVLVTFLFGQVFNLTVLQAKDITNGANGIAGIPAISLMGFSFSNAANFYILALAFAVASFIVIRLILKGPTGRALAAIDENIILAESVGIATHRYQIFAFVVGSMFAGMAGSLFAYYVRYVSPESFTFWDSVALVVMLIIGGRKSHFGALLGAIVLTPLPEFLRSAAAYQNLLYGALLVIILRFLPGGIITLNERLKTLPFRKEEAL